MKHQVLLRAWCIPLLLVAVFLLRVAPGLPPFELFTAIVFLGAVLTGWLLSDRRYLRSFSLTDDRLRLTYLDRWGRSKETVLALRAIEAAWLSRRAGNLLWPALLDLTLEDRLVSFRVTDKALHRALREQLPAHALHLA
ncbi:hypothetical protein [Flaviaesturariibacter amylovorans]|uniref:PH domain-containing protein n=1 Tax=Flaviaesturariibacter amylovorans TaxID=1084520 RepID=A0ABP8GDF9_9BACT